MVEGRKTDQASETIEKRRLDNPSKTRKNLFWMQNRMNWQGFLDKARSNLRVAERAYAEGEPDPCVSRAYYAVFHAALAALLKLTDYRRKGQTWDHGNVAAEFSRRLIKHQKIFQSHLARIPADLRTYRHDADYESESVGKKRAGQVLKLAQEFVNEVVMKLGEQL